MTSNDDLRAIQLAVLPEIRNKGARVHPTIVRSLLFTIAIDTDNGRHPVRRKELAAAAGLGTHSTNYMNAIVGQLTLAGILNMSLTRRSPGVGLPVARGLSINYERLAANTRAPLTRLAAAPDPEGVASRPVPPELLELRDKVLCELGVGAAYIGVEDRKTRDPRRVHLRAEACRVIRARWKIRKGVRLTDHDLGRLLGLLHKSVSYALKTYPTKPEPQGAAA